MALTPNIQASQGFVFAITDGATPEEKISQAFVTAVVNFPTEEIQNSQSFVTVVTDGPTPSVFVSQAYITVVARGRVDEPRVRAWTFTLDGHDFYVLRLGTIETLVYDTLSQQWYTWGSDNGNLWRAYTGENWLGAGLITNDYGSNIVVGDDGNGAIYLLDPDGEVDDDALVGSDTARPYERSLEGQVVTKGYSAVPCFGVQLQGSIGKVDDASYTNVTLSVSDDQGDTYTDCGTITITPDDPDVRVHWRSLGSLRAPGRLFKVVDYGALTRIDALDMEDGN